MHDLKAFEQATSPQALRALFDEVAVAFSPPPPVKEERGMPGAFVDGVLEQEIL